MDEMKKLIEAAMQQRMQDGYQKLRTTEVVREADEHSDRIQREYEQITAGLTDYQKKILREYSNDIFEMEAKNEAFFYRLGLRDGYLLRKLIKNFMKTD